MATTTISPAELANMIIAGAENLNSNKEYINDLNVFPVPDGDTGTNMSLTIMSAAEQIKSCNNMNMTALAKCISSGSLKGARGNSGVILSQLLRGFCKAIEDFNELDSRIIADACVRSVETAYKAVMRPKEGTILTVARGLSEKASEICDSTPELMVFFDKVMASGEKMLDLTPEMLPVLKEAGVVDAGGKGLLVFLDGAIKRFGNKNSDVSYSSASALTKEAVNKVQTQQFKSPVSVSSAASLSTEDIKFGYCTEFIINLNGEFTDKDEKKFKTFLSGLGDSIVCVSLDDIVKIHVHTNDPGKVLSRAITYGELTNLKIDNMREEHREILFNSSTDSSSLTDPENNTNTGEQVEAVSNSTPVYDKKYGFVSVSTGQGLCDLFTALGCDSIIEGGQTMNPSTSDILSAINSINAENIFILPNNKNIILAANQAGELTTDRNIIVIPTTTIPQGITAMLNFDPESDTECNTGNLSEAISMVKTGQVTYSVRDTTIDDRKISKNDFMGITDNGIVSNGTDISQVIMEMMSDICTEDSSIISVYYGQDVNEEEVRVIENMIGEKYPDYELSVISGGQPVYFYIISVE